MTANEHGVWLGANRALVRKAMIAFTGVFALLIAAIMIGAFFLESGYGLKEFLQPDRHLVVLIVEIVGALAILLAAVYLSDFRGHIEPEADGYFDIVSLVCSRVAMIATAVIVFVMFYEVVARYVFISPTLWVNELSLWIAGLVFLLAGLYAMQQRSHIRIYIIYDIMPRWLRKLSDVISVTLIWGFAVSLIWGGFNESRDKVLRWETFGTAWDPPIPATVKPAILVIVAMVAVQALSNLIADWRKAPESHAAMEEIDETEIELIRKSLKD